MGYIKLENISKSYLAEHRPSITRIMLNRAPRTLVLKDISFEVFPGEVLGVIGKNGVGKSTLLRLVGGVYEKDSGHLLTEGDIVSIFELGSFFNTEITGARYCRDYFRFRGLKGQELTRTIQSVYEFTELGEFFQQPIKNYSSGMQAKLLFGVATALPARIILIDEFLVVGDEYFRGKAWERLRQFIAAGTTGIIVSHDWVAMMKLCKRAMILSREGIEFIGPAYEAVQQYLNIPFVESEEIRFKDRQRLVSTPVFARTGEDFRFCFEAEVLAPFRDSSFAVGFSIERYQEGVGWSLALTGSSVVEVQGRQMIEVELTIPALPLAPGDYLLCLFFSTPLKAGQKSTEKVYESLTWLNGRPLSLVVEGENPQRKLFHRRLQWRVQSLSN